MRSDSSEGETADRVRLAYGKEGLDFRLPRGHDVQVFRTRPCPGLADPSNAIRRVLEEPTGSAPLGEVARGRSSACVVICDITRPVPNAILLPPILEQLEGAGIARESITVLIATGIHRPNEGDELVELVGPEIASKYKCINHLSKDENVLRYVGQTRAAIPIYCNRHYLNADLKVLTGFIEPHLWAGYSGGRKLILPGITGLETMKYMHGYEMIDHPGTTYGNLTDNPFHEAGLEVAQMVGVDFIVNITLNESRKITGVFAGHHELAHLEGVAFCENWSVVETDKPFDLAVTCGGGQPLDKTLYQTVKGMSGANPIVRSGGTILVASQCELGAGSPEFKGLIERAESVDQFLNMLRHPGFFEVDQWIAQEMYQIRKDKQIAMYSEGLTRDELTSYLLEPVEDVQAYVDRYVIQNPAARIAVMPEGPYVITRLSK